MPRTRVSQPPVILFYDHTAALSGGEISLLHLVSHLHRDRYTPVVVLGEDGPLKEKLAAVGIETYVLPLDSKISKTKKDTLGTKGILLKLGSIGRLWSYVWKLSRFMRRHRVALVHTNSLKSDIIGGLAARLARRPVLWHVRDCIDTDYLPGTAVRLFRTACRYLPNHIIAISGAVRETLALPPGKPVTVVHNGVPPAALPTPGEHGNAALVVGMVGRITRWKGQHIFLRAAAKLREQFPNVHYQIVGAAMFGETDYEDEIHELTRSLQLEGCVEFLGFRSDVMQVINGFDIVVHASTSAEPFGKVVIEGMLAGKPVVATDGGGIRDIVVHGETGLLVPMGDEVTMADAIATLLQDEHRATEMGKAGRERVLQHFTIQQTVEGVEAVYDNLLK